MKRINLFLLLLLSTLSFAQSWQSKDVVRIENTESSFHYTFYDSTTLYIQKQNVSYIVSLPNSNYIQVGYLYEGATSKIMSCTYNTLTQPVLSSNSELVDTLNAWLNEPSSSGGGGSQTLSISNDTLTISNGNSIVLPTGTSSLFPNGYTFIAEDYEIKASDEGKIIYSIIGTPVNVTMPASVIFTGGMNIGLLLINGGTFQRTSNDAPIEVLPYIGGTVLDTINNKAGEFLLFQTVAIGDGGNSQLQLISTSVLEDNGVLKTTLKYLYDKSQNAIPLSGTEVGKPVTGDIDFANANIIFNNIDGDKFIKFGFNTATDETGLYFDNGLDPQTRFSIYNGDIQCYMPIGSYFSFANDYLGFSNNGNSSFVGIRGGEDYSNIITDLDYPQKIYVGFRGTATLSSGTVTVTTDKIKTGYKIYLSVNTPSGTQGFLSAPTGSIVDETEFVINSTSATDDSTVNWWIAP